MEITNPRRILAVGQVDSGLLELVQGLTGSLPSLDRSSLAGTTYNWDIKTSYYTATIPIWLDEISSPSAWTAEFLAPEAREVLESLGAFIICFKKPVNLADQEEIENVLHYVSQVVKQGCGLKWNGVCLAVAMSQSITPNLEKSFDEWEELCQDYGFEFIDFTMKGRNQYSEPLGLDRLKEALESNEWESDYQAGVGVDFLEDFDEVEGEFSGFQAEAALMEKEMQEMRDAMRENHLAIETETEHTKNLEEEVERLEAIISKINMARESSADLPTTEKRRLAAKVMSEVLEKF